MAQRLSPALCKTPQGHYGHYCPACDEMHLFAVDEPFRNGCKWAFNGNVQKPSFFPSMKIDWAGGYGEDRAPRTCHYLITDGKIIYCGDCTHDYKGATIDLPALPIGYCDTEGTA